jgi:hypothetical protein
VGTSLLGAVVTWLFRIDTTGVNLEQIGNEQRSRTDALRNATAASQ